MRIYVIHNFYQHPGGEDVVFHQEVQELSRNHDVAVYSCRNLRGLKGVAQFISYPYNLCISKEIIQHIKKFCPDVVHIHNLHYGIGPLIVRKIDNLGIPVVMTLHNYRLLCPSASLFFRGSVFKTSIQENFPWTAIKHKVLDASLLKTFITGFTYWLHRKLKTWDKVSRYVVLSSFAKDIFRHSTFPADIGKFVVRPNALDVPKNDLTKADYFIYIGRLSEEKGIIPLLEAISEMNVKLKVYGSGPQEKQALAIAERNPKIELMGFQSPELLSSSIATASALIVPSICYEGMPMAIIEAFGSGTPVLASAVGILNKMVLPLYTGLHFDPHNKESIKSTIGQWQVLDQTIKRKISQNCRAEYEKNYTLQHNLNSLLQIYSDVLHEKKGKK